MAMLTYPTTSSALATLDSNRSSYLNMSSYSSANEDSCDLLPNVTSANIANVTYSCAASSTNSTTYTLPVM